MDRRSTLLWWHLNVLNKRRYDAVAEVYGDIAAAEKHLSEEFLRGLGLRPETVRAALMRYEDFDLEKAERILTQRNLQVLTIHDPGYPAILRQTADPPIFLCYKGDLACLSQPLIAVVGTRDMTQYGRRAAGLFVPAFVRAGCITVSGLAHGIDTAVARETLLAGGRTIAVLGNGLGNIFPPSNEKLAEEIVEKGGLLLSEFPVGMTPDTHTFPARNRIIAGLARATVVIEAPAQSGALITAAFALDEGREVFAVPGQVTDPISAGSNALIAKGQAQLAATPEQVLREVGIVAPADPGSAPSYTPGTPGERRVWEALTTLPQTVDTLVEKTRLPAAEVGVCLTMMELSGAVKNTGGGAWVRA